MSKRYFCIHGHFYQPPREDAITGFIPDDPGLTPFHNWNEKIHAECYKPNAELGNYERISFNIGPTLFHWMEDYDPNTFRSIIEQENLNYQKYGVGNALAQPYNHVIMPLAEYRDKLTQVKWGIADYHHRFGHNPDGMWLPETAVDYETLEVMADCGIIFTILAPWQAKMHGNDTTIPYRVKLNNGKSIVVFFYQMDISTRISFDPGATSNADRYLVDYLLPAYTNNKQEELILAASDGELYGHHQKFRDKFMQRLISGPVLDGKVQYTFPGLYLRQHTIKKTCKIEPKTSWSCHHGVARWMEDCGCTPGSVWKAPLRLALDNIARLIDQYYEKEISKIHPDPWRLRGEYIDVILEKKNIFEFGQEILSREMNSDEVRWLKAIMESQVARQKMFTSCGWFFDELNRIEPRNNIGYAAQSILLVEFATKERLVDRAASYLKNVVSSRFNIDGYTIFHEYYKRGENNLTDFFKELS